MSDKEDGRPARQRWTGRKPVGIVPTAVYTREQVCALLGIGDTKLRELVHGGRLFSLDFTAHWRFLGEQILELCRDASRGAS